MDVAVELSGLTKRFDRRTVVDHLDMTVRAGRIHALVGPNGAGKSTTLRMLVGLVRPTSGSGTVLGEPLHLPARFAGRVGAVIDGAAFHPSMSGRANLRILVAAGDLDVRRIDAVLDVAGLRDRADDPVRSYSLGARQRLALAAALLPDPELLILDEPTNGLDPAGARWVRDLLERVADDGATVIVSSHDLVGLEAIADDVTVLDRGWRRFSGPVDALLGTSRRVVLRPQHAEDAEHLVEMCRLLDVRSDRVGGCVLVDDDTDLARLNREAMHMGIALVEISPHHRSLQDVVLDITRATPMRRDAA